MGSKAKTPTPVQQGGQMAPRQTQVNPYGWGGMGPNMPQNPQQMGTTQTGIGTGAPAWAQGDFAMPWWGQQAPNVGAAMMQQQDPVGYGNQSRMGLPGTTPPTAGSAVMPGPYAANRARPSPFGMFYGQDGGTNMPQFGGSAVMPGSSSGGRVGINMPSLSSGGRIGTNMPQFGGSAVMPGPSSGGRIGTNMPYGNSAVIQQQQMLRRKPGLPYEDPQMMYMNGLGNSM